MAKRKPKIIDENLIAREIKRSKILPDSCKERVVRQILLELQDVKPQTWFRCKMILFQNRHSEIGKDEYFNWLYETHLKELIDHLKGE